MIHFLVFLILNFITTYNNTTDDTIVPETNNTTSLPKIRPQSHLIIFQKLNFTKLIKKNVTPNFNINNLISKTNTPKNYNHTNLTTPNNTPKIDNQLTNLIPLLKLANLNTFENLLQNTIKNNNILIILQINNINDFLNNNKITIILRTKHNIPLLNTDKLILSNQTFNLNKESPNNLTKNSYIENNILHTNPFETRLPLIIFNMKYKITFHNTQIQTKLTNNNNLINKLIKNKITLENLYSINKITTTNNTNVLENIKLIINKTNNLEPNETNKCQQISNTFAFNTISTFFFKKKK